ncbi:hypothetical protein BDW59DRAFT_172128 [Aspergillus cavernicola]|uniref:NAD(P)-binding protein n=1 Tax=Aspergillus cavernicola TaxID=176166 RepID=A0ABR4IER1_9EURO
MPFGCNPRRVMSWRVWHIRGANTGFGLELALKTIAEGDHVIAALRTLQEMNDYAEKAFAAFGKIDVLVNNAAYSYMGAIEESEVSAVKAQFDTNVFALLRTGTIINFSSIGGLVSLPSNGIYCATKFAVEAITQAWAGEIAPFGLKAIVIEPGYFRTSFTTIASGANIAPPLAAYEGTPAHDARAGFTAYNGAQPGNPVEGVARIWEFVADEGLLKGKKLQWLPLGTDTGGSWVLIRIM